jgi:micrococcal nuclease
MKRFWLLGVIIGCLGLSACSESNIDVVMTTQDTERFWVDLDRCTDGDTARFWVDGESVSVRFLSINTPELGKDGKADEPFAQQAANLTCTTLQQANSIILELDPNLKSTDDYGRWLAYVWVDDVLLQETLIEAGYADLRYAHDRSLYDDVLQRILDWTQSRRLGRWK